MKKNQIQTIFAETKLSQCPCLPCFWNRTNGVIFFKSTWWNIIVCWKNVFHFSTTFGTRTAKRVEFWRNSESYSLTNPVTVWESEIRLQIWQFVESIYFEISATSMTTILENRTWNCLSPWKGKMEISMGHPCMATDMIQIVNGASAVFMVDRYLVPDSIHKRSKGGAE